MRRSKRRNNRALSLAILFILMLLGLQSVVPGTLAEDLSITTFTGDLTEVTATFKGVAGNASTTIDLPKGCTVLSAEMDLEGVRKRGDDVRTLDLSAYDPQTTPHRAWRGWVQGNYPPPYPFWNPSSPRGTAFSASDYDDVGTSDDTRLRTATGQQTTNRYPFHLFRFEVPDGTLTALEVEWEGFGYCLADTPLTRGAEMFVWRNASRVWDRVDSYAKAEAAIDRDLVKAWTTDPGRYVDDDDQFFVLIFGKKSQNVAGPNPWTAEGEISTDHVHLNATLAGDWEEISNPSLTIEPTGEVWSSSGVFISKVRIGAVEGLHTALQQAVDAVPTEPGNVTVHLVLNVTGATAGVMRLSNLTVTVRPIVNQAPTWSGPSLLFMDEDEDALRILDLATVAYDDHSHERLVYELVAASTDAVMGVIEEDHYLSVHAVEKDYWGRVIFRVNATDAWGLTTTSPPIEVQVREVNDPPRVTAPGRLSAIQDEPFYYKVEASDPESDPLTFAIDTEAFAIDGATGEIDLTPTNDMVGLYKVNVTVSDGRGGRTVSWMELDVANVNDPPSIRDPGPLSGVQGEPFEHTFLADDIDMPHGEQLSWTILGDDFYKNNLQLNPLTGELVWLQIGNSDVGVHLFIVKVADSQGADDRVNVTLTIDNVNDPPSFMTVPDLTVFEDGQLSYSIRVTDLDLRIDVGETLKWTVEPSLFEISEVGAFMFVPGREDIGTYTILVTVTDGAGESFSQAFTLTVKAINHPPVIEQVPDQTVTEDVEWTVEIVVSDRDPGDVVQVSARGAPFKVPVEGGIITWTPEQRHGGEHTVTIEALDTSGGKTVMAFNLTVITVNDPPTIEIIVPPQGQRFPDGEEIRLTALAEDEEGAHLDLVWKWRHADSVNEQWTRIDTGTDVLWGKPPHGRILLRVEASDAASTVFDEVVFEVEAPPTDDNGGGAGIALAIIAIIAVVVLRLLTRGRYWGTTKEAAQSEKGDEGEKGEEPMDEWESVPEDEEDQSPWWR